MIKYNGYIIWNAAIRKCDLQWNIILSGLPNPNWPSFSPKFSLLFILYFEQFFILLLFVSALTWPYLLVKNPSFTYKSLLFSGLCNQIIFMQPCPFRCTNFVPYTRQSVIPPRLIYFPSLIWNASVNFYNIFWRSVFIDSLTVLQTWSYAWSIYPWPFKQDSRLAIVLKSLIILTKFH